MNRIDEAVDELIADTPAPPGIATLRRRIRRRRYTRSTAVLLLGSASIACVALLVATITNSTRPARVSVSSPTTATSPRSTSATGSPVPRHNLVAIGVEILASGSHANQILAVEPGSPAAAVGLAPGDTITAINQTKVASLSGMDAALRHFHPGDVIMITWSDPSRTTRTANLRLAAPPSSPMESIPSAIVRAPATTTRPSP